MTEQQIAVCQTCLNRKKGNFELQEICNLRGHQLEVDADCTYYTKDNSVIVAGVDKKLFLKPNVERARYAIIMIVIVMFLDIISAISSYFQLSLLNDINEGMFVSEAAISSNDLREQIIAIIYLVVLIISAVIFIQWFRRAYYNLQVRTGTCEHSDGWAAGCWFVPIISLFRPYQIMKELEKKTSQLLGTATGTTVHSNTTVISFWWALWLITNYLGNYIFKMAFKEESLENFINGTTVEMINSGLGVPLSLLTIYMIKTYASKEANLVAIEMQK